MNVDWTAVGAVATAAAALITAWMAAMTRGSIRQTQRHHRDAFRPLVVFMPYDGIDPQARKELIDFKATVEGSRVYALELRGTLQNIGVGPALNLRLRLGRVNTNCPDDADARHCCSWKSAPSNLPLSSIVCPSNEATSA